MSLTTVAPVSYVDFPVRVRELQVVRTRWISRSMVRLTAGGPATAGFESGIFDEHIKVMFPDPGTGELRLPTPDGDELNWPRPFPTSREYTVRAHRPDLNEIDIDFVVHPGGLASDWVCAVAPGAPVHVAGPPGGYRIDTGYDHYVLAGDGTALPAMARWLAEAPEGVSASVVIEVPDAGSELPLAHRDGVQVTWLHTGRGGGTHLDEAVRGLDLPPGQLFVWLAGEAGAIKPLRRWVREDLGIDKHHSSITGYWKRGQADTHEHLDDDDDLDEE